MRESGRLMFLLTVLLGVSVANAYASSSNYAPISVALPAFSKECFYFDLTSPDDAIIVSYQVLTGGNFEIDFNIKSPAGEYIVEDRQKKYSDYLLRSFGLGQYTFCMSNNYGTALKKVELILELEKQNLVSTENVNSKKENDEDALANNSIEEIERSLNKITKTMNYLRAREWRNMSTVQSTESRLTWLSLLIMGVMIGISIVQSLIIQFFFTSRQRNFV